MVSSSKAALSVRQGETKAGSAVLIIPVECSAVAVHATTALPVKYPGHRILYEENVLLMTYDLFFVHFLLWLWYCDFIIFALCLHSFRIKIIVVVNNNIHHHLHRHRRHHHTLY